MQGTESSCQLDETIIAYWYLMSMITCKWFGYCGVAGVCSIGRWKKRNGTTCPARRCCNRIGAETWRVRPMHRAQLSKWIGAKGS